MAVLAASVALGTGVVVLAVILAFGIGLITFTTVVSNIDTIHGIIETSIGSLPADLVAIMNLAGILEGLALVLAAITARIALIFATKVATGLTAAAT